MSIRSVKASEASPLSPYSAAPRKPKDPDDDVRLWFDRIARGHELRKGELEIWDSCRRHSRNLGDKGDDLIDSLGREKIRVNKIGAWIENRLPALLFQRPRARLTPKTQDGYVVTGVMLESGEQALSGDAYVSGMGLQGIGVERYRVLEAVMNQVISSPSFAQKWKLRMFAKSGLTSMGVVKVGYAPDFGEDGDLLGEKWFMDYVLPESIIFDPDGGNDLREHSWICGITIKTMAEIKSNKLLSNTEDICSTIQSRRSGLREALDNDEDVVYGHRPQKEPEDNALVKLYEIYDMVNDRVIYLADGHGKKLRDDKTPKGIDQHPYVFFRPVEREGEAYPDPPVADLIPLAREYDTYRQMKMRAMRKTARKWVTFRGLFSPEQKELLESEADNIIVEANRKDFKNEIAPLPQLDISGSMHAYGYEISQDFDQVSGQPAQVRGGAAYKTATQIQSTDAYNSIRSDYMRDIFADAILDVYRKLLNSVQANLTKRIAVKVVGIDGLGYYTYADKESVIGDYDLSIDIDEMVPQNSEMMRAQFAAALQAASAASFMLTEERVTRKFLEMYGIKDPDVIAGVTSAAQAAMAPPPQQQGPAVPGDVGSMISGAMGPAGGVG